jgi:hypothetical protein
VFLLFWLSLVPFGTAWMGENDFALQWAIIRSQGEDSLLRQAVGKDLKGKVSLVGGGPASGAPYRFTVNRLALLLPIAVVTVTFTLPSLAFAGTRHVTRLSLQDTYFVHFFAPNRT